MGDQYAAFARDYDWLFSDFRQVGNRHVQDAAPRLGTREHPRVLDCACGTGLLALALARHGYEVVGTDASPEMVEQAANRAEREGLSLTLLACRWQDLPRRFEREFDFVFCSGNSIAHCRDEAEMVASLAGIRAVIKPGGWLILETRDWEMLDRNRVRFTSLGLRERGGTRCIPLYVWNFAEGATAPVVVEVVFLFETDGAVSLRSYPITYHPFTARQLGDRLREAGFAEVQTDAESGGFLRVAAHD